MSEIGTLAGARHPHILHFYGYQSIGTDMMLVFPWSENGSLDVYIRKHKKLRSVEKLKLLCDAARGLEFLHSRRPPIVHGNLKPGNVFITNELRAALRFFGTLDFLTYALEDYESGLPWFASTPPKAQGYSLGLDLTSTSDVYGFGGIILAIMSGKQPFHQISRLDAQAAILSSRVPQPADHLGLDRKDPLWNFLRKCWSVRPTDRPSAREVVTTVCRPCMLAPLQKAHVSPQWNSSRTRS
ncbi:hypothetical protein M407DRAFT_85510 [Tulasnella calospora MUT 4182]|uniref:Protein kinase domain-containing protein n=1 Tax=Tulasnella calospora MUT 4182 TaxID=1051891 RepID=A0A0C3PQN0_9AGAM|nr:hypothetical protein M407DRAFT_85510 [Tulasnella calospora MUT 4182]